MIHTAPKLYSRVVHTLPCFFLIYLFFNLKIMLDQQGNLRIIVKKIKPLLGIAIEGGINTKHLLPRIINIHVSIIGNKSRTKYKF